MDDLIRKADVLALAKDVVLKNGALHRCIDATQIHELPSAEPEYPTDVEEVLDYLDNVLHPILPPENWNVYSELHDMVAKMPSAQPGEWLENYVSAILQAGLEGREVSFKVGDRTFAVREIRNDTRESDC